jgi:hypothetical protein
MSLSDDYNPELEYYEIMRQLVNREADSALQETDELREAGFLPVQVRGADFVVWEREGEHFTTQAALRKIRTSEKPSGDALTLIEQGFSPVQVSGSQSMILVQNGSYFTLEAAMEEIVHNVEDD